MHSRDERGNIGNLFKLPAPYEQSLLEWTDLMTNLTYSEKYHKKLGRFNYKSRLFFKNSLRVETGEMYLVVWPDVDIKRLAMTFLTMLLVAIFLLFLLENCS